ncbi:Nse1 non-SMC component of SMC5-6 complex-domain-containing protein [Nemania sp. FL0916]|nr:Nse1 non-SMC component of SMC5-6 complex-domain-containing protein [Nemania sp. FL0916]
MDEDQDEPIGQYSDGNRAFLQAFLARGTMTFKESQPILAAIFTAQEGGREATEPNQVTQEDFESFVSAASAAVSQFDLEVRSAMHQHRRRRGERVYALVNTTSDPLTQLATLHTPDEIAFVKRVIDAMFEKYNTPRMEALCLDEMQANKLRVPPRQESDDDEGGGGGDGPSELNGANGGANGEGGRASQHAPKGLKSSEVETVMRSMVDEGWFERSREGFYCLSPRALLELRSWLLESYNDPDAEADEWQRLKFCIACKDAVTIGQRCAERDCLVRLHDNCADAFFRTRRQQACPKCAKEWDGKHFVGERAVTETEAYQRGRRRSGKSARNSNLVEEIMHDDEEDEEEDGEGEE